MKAIALVASVLATVMVACSLPRDEVERRVLDSGSLRQLALAGDGRFAQCAGPFGPRRRARAGGGS